MERPSRRHFLQGSFAFAGLGLLAGCRAVPSTAVAPPKVPQIGYLAPDRPSHFTEAFRQGMHELGYVEGRDIVIEWRWSEDDEQRLPDLAQELVRLQVDVIVARGSQAIRAAKQASSTIPIVMAAANDPVGSGFVASLGRPGGNVTGLALYQPLLSGKRLELLKEVLPRSIRVGVLLNRGNPAAEAQWGQAEAAARSLNLHLNAVDVRVPEDIEGALDTLIREGADALLPLADSLITNHQARLAGLTVQRRLPAVYDWREFAVAGGLMAYGPSLSGINRHASAYVDKILKGAKPSDMPVEQPTTLDFVINLKTAQALGLTIPQSLLVQATEVIQ